MQIIRTIVWVLAAVLLTVFIAINWTIVPIVVWPLSHPPMHVQGPLGVLILLGVVVGFVPMWLWSKAGRWRLNRRIGALENTVRAVTPTAPLHSAETYNPALSNAAVADAVDHRYEP